MTKSKKPDKPKVARIAVAFDDKGHYVVTGSWRFGERFKDHAILSHLDRESPRYYPHRAIVEVELVPPSAKVRSVKAVDP